MPRLATVVPRAVSPTVMPMTSPKVKMLLTSGRPNSVVFANSASRCNGCGFIVNFVNSTLSISVTVRLMRGFELEHGLERLGLGGEQVALHITKRDARAVGDAPRESHRLGLQFVIGDDAVDDADPPRFLGVDDVGGEIELARFRGADEPGQAP